MLVSYVSNLNLRLLHLFSDSDQRKTSKFQIQRESHTRNEHTTILNHEKFPFADSLGNLNGQAFVHTWASKSDYSLVFSHDSFSSIKSPDHFFRGYFIKSFRNGVWFCSNRFANGAIDLHHAKKESKHLAAFGKSSQICNLKVNRNHVKLEGKQPDCQSFLSFGTKFRSCSNRFLHRCFKTTTGITDGNEENPTSEMSYQNVGDGNSLTHVNMEGKANMVDVAGKQDTARYSVATATVKLGEKAFNLVKDNKLQKGDVVNVAKLAGIMGAKQTALIIPLCHNILLSSVEVDIELDEATHSIVIQGKVRCFGKTGVEMEALTSVSVSALTVYDMCKAVSKDIIITDVQLMIKDGGKSGYFARQPGN